MKVKDSPGKPGDDNIDLQVEIKLAEYGKLQDRILEKERSQQQVLILGLGAVSIVIPIIIGQVTQLPQEILAALLLTLSIIFWALTINYVIVNFELALVTSYIHRTISPDINRVVPNKQPLLDYEHHLRVYRRKPIGLFLANIGSFAAEIILVLPAIFAFFAAQYLLALPKAVADPSLAAAQQLISSWLGPLTAVTWLCVILTGLTYIGCTVFWLTSGEFIAKK